MTNSKKIWTATTYILLTLSIVQTLYAIFLGNVFFISKGLIYITFTTSLFLKNKLDNKNKIVEILFFISCTLIILFDVIKLIFN